MREAPPFGGGGTMKARLHAVPCAVARGSLLIPHTSLMPGGDVTPPIG